LGEEELNTGQIITEKQYANLLIKTKELSNGIETLQRSGYFIE